MEARVGVGSYVVIVRRAGSTSTKGQGELGESQRSKEEVERRKGKTSTCRQIRA